MGNKMRNARRGAAGIRAFVTEAGIDVDGWCVDQLDSVVATRSLRKELAITKPDPDDLVDDYDFISVWCGPAGEVDGGMHLRTRQPRRPLLELVGAADAWLAAGGLTGTPGDTIGSTCQQHPGCSMLSRHASGSARSRP